MPENRRRASSYSTSFPHALEQCGTLGHAAKSCTLHITPFALLYATCKHQSPRSLRPGTQARKCMNPWEHTLTCRSGRLLHGQAMILTKCCMARRFRTSGGRRCGRWSRRCRASGRCPMPPHCTTPWKTFTRYNSSLHLQQLSFRCLVHCACCMC